MYICAEVPLLLCFYFHDCLTEHTAHHVLIKLEASEPQSPSVLSHATLLGTRLTVTGDRAKFFEYVLNTGLPA